MTRTLPISEVKARLPELVTGVEEREEEVVVTRKGKPAAVLVNHAEYARLKETLEVLSDPDPQIRRSRRFSAQRPGQRCRPQGAARPARARPCPRARTAHL
jgi:antitoxin YefM